MNIADAYAQGLHRAVQNGTAAGTATDALVALLKHDGKLALLPSIKRAYERLLYKATQSGPTLTLAHAHDESSAKKSIGDAAHTATVTIDKTLIGGFVFRTDATQIDRSYKSALLSMYRSMTRN